MSIANKYLKRIERLSAEIERLRAANGMNTVAMRRRFNLQNLKTRLQKNLNKLSNEVNAAAAQGPNALQRRFGARTLNSLDQGLRLAKAYSNANRALSAFLQRHPRWSRRHASAYTLAEVIPEDARLQAARNRAEENLAAYVPTITTWAPRVVAAARRAKGRMYAPEGVLGRRTIAAAMQRAATGNSITNTLREHLTRLRRARDGGNHANMRRIYNAMNRNWLAAGGMNGANVMNNAQRIMFRAKLI